MIRTGIILVGVGTLFLLNNLGFLEGVRFSLVWPTLLIVAGLALMVRSPYSCLGCNKKTWNMRTCSDCAHKEN